MPRGKERVPARAVKTSRDGVDVGGEVAAASSWVQERLDAANRHAALCRLLAQGFDRVERAAGVSVGSVAMVALVAAAFHAAPSTRVKVIARLAWDLAEAWLEEGQRFAARQADARREGGGHAAP